MKSIIYIFCFSIPFLSAAQNEATTVKIVHQFFDAVNAHDTVAIANLFSDNAKGESPNWGEAQTGAKAIAHEFARNLAADSMLHFTTQHLIDAKNTVVAEYIFKGTITYSASEVPAYMHGKNYEFPACTIFNILNGKITAIKSYFDQVIFLRQMGFFEQH